MPAIARLAAASLVVLALVGCAATSPDAAPDASSADRVVSTDYGDVTIPDDPQRVVVLNHALAGYLYDLDVPIVAMTPETPDSGEGAFSDFWADEAEASGTVFLPWSVDGFDLEAVLAMEPDLIVGGGLGFPLMQAEQVYDDLSAIAPTVLVGSGLTTWQAQYAFLAVDVFDDAATYDAAVDAYEARIAEVAAAIEPPPGPAAFVTITGDGSAYVLVESMGLPLVFAELGIEPAPLFAQGDFEAYGGPEDMFGLSTEQVGQTLTQPSLFVMGFNGDTTDVATLGRDPIYAALPAFREGHAYDLPYWTLRGDFDETMALLDVVEELFAR